MCKNIMSISGMVVKTRVNGGWGLPKIAKAALRAPLAPLTTIFTAADMPRSTLAGAPFDGWKTWAKWHSGANLRQAS